MSDPTCSVDGCERPQWARTLCGSHYSRWRRRGDVVAPLVQRRGVCSVEGCESKHQARGFCDKHYRRWLDYGDPLIVGTPGAKKGSTAGPKNGAWKGEACGYQAAHLRIEAARGKASAFQCGCGAPARQWAYDHSDPDEKLSPEGFPYSLDVQHYAPMCSSCHTAFDQRR